MINRTRFLWRSGFPPPRRAFLRRYTGYSFVRIIIYSCLCIVNLFLVFSPPEA